MVHEAKSGGTEPTDPEGEKRETAAASELGGSVPDDVQASGDGDDSQPGEVYLHRVFDKPWNPAGDRTREDEAGSAIDVGGRVRKPSPSTGEPRVDAALRLLDDLAELPVHEHAELFERAHAQLSEVLGELDSGPDDAAER